MNQGSTRPEYHWPQLYYNKMPYQNMIRASSFSLKPIALPPEIVEYLLIVCDQLKLSTSTLQLTLSVASRYLRAKPNHLPLQLVIMTSLMICSKFVETNPPELSTLHKYSNNSFTNRDFYRTQMLILTQLNFKIVEEGFPDKQIDLVLRCIKTLLGPDEQAIFPSILIDLEQLLWVYLYTGRVKLKQREVKAIPATLIHLSLVFLTQYSGRFLQTLWACDLTGTEQRHVTLLGNRLLREIVGEEKSKHYKI